MLARTQSSIICWNCEMLPRLMIDSLQSTAQRHQLEDYDEYQ